MDTTCAAILNETYADLSYGAGNLSIDQISDITGLKYFKNLVRFGMSAGGIDIITEWPRKLKYINLDNTGIDSMPNYFPDSLETFEISINAGSDYAWVDKTLPPFPQKLIKFAAYNGLRIKYLPALPASMRHLQISGYQLISLPTLPPLLEYLEIGSSKLQSLPALPTTNRLRYLACTFSLIDSLPSLPTNLQYLDVSNNKLLKQLPSLPNSLQIIKCFGDSSLNSMPPLPLNLKELHIQNANITCLPFLPNNIEKIYFSRNILKCLPNINNNIIAQYAGNLPAICNVTNNVNNCTAFPVIAGYAFYDANSNGIKDANEFYKPNTQIQLSNGNITFTNDSGYYEIGTTAWGFYTVTPSNTFFNVVPASKTVNFISSDTTVFQNFAYRPTAVVDSIEVNLTQSLSWITRPGKPTGYRIVARNVGSSNFGPTTIQLTYDINRLTYDSISNIAFIRSGNKVTLNLLSFSIGEKVVVDIYFTVKITATLGDSVKSVVTVSDGTRTVADSCIGIVRTSYDPNDKRGTPKLSPAQVAAGNYVDYTIRYQNTGTDTAFNVVVTDTLSAQLQANSMEMISTSHNTKTTIIGNVISFEMRDIMLPHMSMNEPKSHGFIRFRIKPKSTLALGDSIKNKAAIYFDYNSPVITNNAITLIKNESTFPLNLILFRGNRNNEGNIQLYWTTANEINTKTFLIEQSSDGRLFSVAGEKSAIGKGNNSYSSNIANTPKIDLFFRLKMVDKDGSFTYSSVILIKETTKNAGFTLHQNPVSNEMVLNIVSSSLLNTEALLLNNIGIVVKRFAIKELKQKINVSDLPVGVYSLKTMQGNERVLVSR